MLFGFRSLLASVFCILVLALPATAAPLAPADDPTQAVPGEVVVTWTTGSTPAQQQRAQQRVAGVAAERVVNAAAGVAAVDLVRLPTTGRVSAAIASLRADGAVATAEPNWIYHTQLTSSDPLYLNSSLWGMYGDASSPANTFGSQAAEAWAAGSVGSRAVYVGVLDEGIQVTHPDLAGNAWTNPFDRVDGIDNDGNGYRDDVNGWDFVGDNNSVYDGGTRARSDSHGTHVAGTIGASANTVGVIGVSPEVTFISAKFLGRNGGTLANAIRAIDYFVGLKTRHGLNLVAINNSWGGGGHSQALLDAINRAGNEGMLFIVAAGNGGSDGVGDNNDAVPSYPSNYQCTANAAFDCVVAVAAIDEFGGRAAFSNYGVTSVDLGAPGVSVMSTLPFNTYGRYSGTSMATPHVTGAVALWAASHPLAGAAQIRAAIMQAAPTASLAGRTVTGGRLDASTF